jgi:hypothetical protein
MRWLSGDGKIVSATPSAFDEQFEDLQAGVSAAASEIIRERDAEVYRERCTRNGKTGAQIKFKPGPSQGAQ